MVKLFIYDLLQDSHLQTELFGRDLNPSYGLVDNYILLRDCSVDGVASPRLYPHSASCVVGQIIEITEEELMILDNHMTDAYVRNTIHVKNQGVMDTYFMNLSK